MFAREAILALVGPYLLASAIAFFVQRIRILPAHASEETLALNHAGKLTGAQQRALLLYAAPELVFTVTALLLAILWQPDAGLQGAVLRWGLAGMALVRFSLSAYVWSDLLSGKVEMLRGPLRKIQFRKRHALATEDGPIVVLPVERSIYEAHAAGAPATIYYTPHAKYVVAVVSEPGATEATLAPVQPIA